MNPTIRAKVVQRIVDELEPARWSIPEDFLTFSHFERVVKELEWNSSPGYPYCITTPTNRILFGVEEGIPSQQSMNRVWEMVQRQIRERMADPIRFFVKPEPHSNRKLKDERYRLISSVSVIDQIIDHMLFDDMNHALIANCDRTPIKAGWTPMKGGWRWIPKHGVESTDKQAFDHTAMGWQFEVELDIRKKLCNNMNPLWEELALWRYSMLFMEPIFVTSGGLLLKQRRPGIMKSGCVNTITTNSIIQLIIHYRVALELGIDLRFIWAMGDDVIQEKQEQLFYDLLSQYVIVKEKSSHVEFAGYRYNWRTIEPLYRAKHAFNLLHQKVSYLKETADAYALLYAKSSSSGLMRKVLSEIHPSLATQEFLDALWDEA
uniref:RNA-dependent RNA polymerase n=1 Tax=Sherman virus TaxID=1888323 RepID=A0A1B2RVP8_9VIRU|nr:RNA-dependent RNA polymerase [Sherman virus]